MLDRETIAAKFADAVSVSSTGVGFGYTNETLDEMSARFAELFGEDFDRTPQTVAGRIIEAAMRAMVYAVGYAAGNAGQLNAAYATGRYLDSLGELYDLPREGARPTSVRCDIGGVPNAVAMPGFVISDSEGNRLVTKSAVTVQADGTAQTVAEYEDGSAVAIPSPGEVFTMESSADGIESFRASESPGGIVAGCGTESDASLRGRIAAERSGMSPYLVGIVDEVQAMRGVLSCFCYENGSYGHVYITKSKEVLASYPTGGDVIQVSAHSMICVVDYDTDIVGTGKEVSEDELDVRVASILYRKRSAGCGMTPIYRKESKATVDPTDRVEVDATKAAAQVKAVAIPDLGYEMVFNKAEVVDFGIAISVGKKHYSGTAAQLAADITTAIRAWQDGGVAKVDRPSVGRAVYPYEVAAAVSNVIPEIQVKSVRIGTGAEHSGWANAPLGMLISQRAHCPCDATYMKITVDGALVQ